MTLISSLPILGIIKSSEISILPRVFMGFYILPFLTLWGYVFTDSYTFYIPILDSYTYMTDPLVLNKLALIGLIGASGLVTGVLLSAVNSDRKIQLSAINTSLTLFPFVLFVFAACFFSWYFASSETIFQETYVNLAQSSATKVNFSGAGILSYIIIYMVAIDFAFHTQGVSGYPFRKLLLFISLIFIILIFQLLRGRRDVLGLIIALLSLYLMKHGDQIKLTYDKISKKTLCMIALCLILVFVIFKAIGEWRSGASSGQTYIEAIVHQLDIEEIFTGTWSGVLLSPFSAIIQYDGPTSRFLYGSSYMDLLLSIPPGPIAKYFNYERPVEGWRGLSWEMMYGQGGTHITVAPYINFSVPGVFIILMLIGYFIGTVENKARSRDMKILLIHGALIINASGFIWYGELYGVRAIMAAYIAWWMYSIAMRLRKE